MIISNFSKSLFFLSAFALSKISLILQTLFSIFPAFSVLFLFPGYSYPEPAGFPAAAPPCRTAGPGARRTPRSGGAVPRSDPARHRWRNRTRRVRCRGPRPEHFRRRGSSHDPRPPAHSRPAAPERRARGEEPIGPERSPPHCGARAERIRHSRDQAEWAKARSARSCSDLVSS